MRIAVAAIMVLALPVIAAAQSLPPIGLPLPPIGLPLPPIGLPLAPIGLSPPVVTPPRIDAPPIVGPIHQQPRFGSRRGFRPLPTIVYFLPIYDWGVYQMSLAPQPRTSGVTTPYVPSAPAEEPAPTATAAPAVAPAPVAPYVPPPPSTYYFIPGCYMGNVPPTQVTLPANCDLSRLITRKPLP